MGRYAGKILINYILLHSTAHFLHALAVFLQQSGAEGFSHSAAQATQSSAQSLQRAAANDEPLASNLAHRAQMSAQSRQSAIAFKWFLSHMLIQQVAQSSHSMAHAKQASMQFLEFSILFFILFFFSSAVTQPSGSLLPDYFIHVQSTLNILHVMKLREKPSPAEGVQQPHAHESQRLSNQHRKFRLLRE